MSVEIYTDGSCHTQKRIGAWVAIILANQKKTILSGTETNTTNNYLELKAVIKALEFVNENHKKNLSVMVVSDSQYVVRLNDRKEKLVRQNFQTGAGKEIRNVDLVKTFFALSEGISFVKIKAHQQKTVDINYNIEADLLVRKTMRKLLHEF